MFRKPFHAAATTTIALVAATSLFASTSGCSTRRTDVCGEIPAGGGAAVAMTRDQELCEITRIRVQQILAHDVKLDELTADHLHKTAFAWDDAKTMDGLLSRVRRDAGAAYAEAVARAVADVRLYSTKPLSGTCTDEERCLAKGAARGARLAVGDALDYLIRARPPAFRPGEGSQY